jgi:hypothetical protein
VATSSGIVRNGGGYSHGAWDMHTKLNFFWKCLTKENNWIHSSDSTRTHRVLGGAGFIERARSLS